MSHTPSGSSPTHHVLPIRVYAAVFAALLGLTILTVLVSVIDLGQWGLGTLAIGIALAVATAKALLVAGFFMHLRYDNRFHSIVFFGSVIFLVLFFGLTLSDITTREELIEQHGNRVLREDRLAAPPSPTAPAPEASGAAR